MSSISSMSSLSSSEAGDLSDRENAAPTTTASGPPAKKRRVTKAAHPSPPHSPVIKIGTGQDGLPPPSPTFSLSEDDFDYLPGDQNMPDEIAAGAEQVKRCTWGNCAAGDLRDQDALVKHVHDVHVPESKNTKFMCEWADCKAKSKAQGSAYALRAHLRSHTKEKPFYCALPECDRSFTRSDALAKHMRTVHESENLRAFEHQAVKRAAADGQGNSSTNDGTPQPGQRRSSQSTIDAKPVPLAASKPPKSIKLNLGKASPRTTTPADDISIAPSTPVSPSDRDAVFGAFANELDFDLEERNMNRRDLYTLLKQQLVWAQEEANEIRGDNDQTTNLHHQEWFSKELVLENVMEGKLFQGVRKQVFSDPSTLAIDTGDDPDRREMSGRHIYETLLLDANESCRIPVHGDTKPWYREGDWVNQMQKIGETNKTDIEKLQAAIDSKKHAVNGDATKTEVMDLDATEDELA